MLFLSTPSARRATKISQSATCCSMISIHALREEGDSRWSASWSRAQNFYPRPPRGGRLNGHGPAPAAENFYPRPPRGGRPGPLRYPKGMEPISIHALREEGDLSSIVKLPPHIISIHALREEGDIYIVDGTPVLDDFYPRPPRGGRPKFNFSWSLPHLFLSTPSARRATSPLSCYTCAKSISIHALREEGDSKNRDKISIFKQTIQHSARI